MKQTGAIKYFTIIFTIIILSIFMSGCQEDSDGDVSDVVTVNTSKEEMVSEEYAQRYRDYAKELNYYMTKQNESIKNKTFTSVEHIEVMTKGVIFTSENKTLHPTNEAERVLDEYVFNMSYHLKQMLEYSLKLVNTKDKSYAPLAYNAQENYNHEIRIVRELLVKYGINN